ncbi:MAG TPA: hypothetical protein VJO52_05680 [Gemmatimonadaceae bacterium]|nr:hypothetical protein [Gemmatimonadaceae bacterium]
MPEFFPRKTIEFRALELKLPRRVSLSLIGMAGLTAVLVRLLRLVVRSNPNLSVWELLPIFAVGYFILLGMAAAYLGNHPVHQWVWRAPLFAVLESVSEAIVSAIFIAMHVERIGQAHAEWVNWLPMSLTTLARSCLSILVFSLVLAFVVQTVRRSLIHKERGEEEKHA